MLTLNWNKPLYSQQNKTDSFKAYCTANHDGTGTCIAQDTNKAMTCLLVPGQVVECKGPKVKSSQCIMIGNISAQQAELSCITSKQQTDASSIENNLSSPFDEDALYSPPQQSF